MSLPSDKEARKVVLDRVTKCVNLLKEVDTLKEDVKTYADEISDRYGMSKGDFNSLVKTAYDEAKINEQIEKLQTGLSEWEILQGQEG